MSLPNCAHPGCNCPEEVGEVFCGVACRETSALLDENIESENHEPTMEACPCGHPECVRAHASGPSIGVVDADEDEGDRKTWI